MPSLRHIAALALVSCAPLVGPTAAMGASFEVALTGDSIVEGCSHRSPGRFGGLGAAVLAELRALGVRASRGYLPAHDAVVSLPEAPRSYWPLHYSGSWTFEGTFGSLPSPFAADGFTSSTSDPAASIDVTLEADRVGVLYGAGPDGGRFDLELAGRSQRIDSHAEHASTALTWLDAPKAIDRLRIAGAKGGRVRFAGLIARRRAAEVQLDQVGRSGAQAADAFAPTNRQALRALEPDLTVIMFGTNEEGAALAGPQRDAERRLARGLAARARLARKSGACAFVPHAPNGRPPALQARLREVAARVARDHGCDVHPVFSRVWASGESSVGDGLTADGIHPTAAGYELMGARLARLIEGYRARSISR